MKHGHTEFHERLARNQDSHQMGSNRSFGIVFFVAFCIFGAIAYKSGSRAWVWWGSGAAFFLAAGLFFPRILTPLNRIWFRLGLFLGSIMNPIIMSLLFYLTITPIALLMRLFGKRPLNLKFDPTASSYWIIRDSQDITPESFKNQF